MPGELTQDELDLMRRWDEDYYAHVFVTAEEYQHRMVVAAEGDYIEFSDGTRLLDFTTGLLCVTAGHRNPHITKGIVDALERFGFVYEGLATPYRARATKLIMEDILGPDGWAGRIRFTASGSEAVELALMVAKLVTDRPNIVSRDFAYHGWTHGAISAMGLPGSRGILAAPGGEVRRPAGIPAQGFHFAPAPYCRHCPIGHTYPGCTVGRDLLPCVSALEHQILTLGADSVAAVIAESIFGVGMIHPPAEYLRQMREMTRDLGVLWIDDEVMTGFARTGKWFAYQHAEGVTPDLMTIGKGVVSAALPVGGLVMSKDIARFMDDYRWETVGTFSGHPIAMAAAAANIEWLLSVDAPARAAEQGRIIGELMRELQRKHPCIVDVQGAGLLWAIELRRQDGSRVIEADRHFIPTGDVLTPSLFVAIEAAKHGMSIATAPPNTLRLGPSLVASEETLRKGAAILDEVLTAFEAWAG
jgi:taurine--2-oxoglutarate transaminase